jgi:hypothetical protein
MAKSLQEVMRKYQSGTANGQAAWLNAVESYEGNPMEEAAAAEERWETGVRKAAQEKKFSQRCRATPKEKWKANARAKQSRYSEGTKQGVASMTAFMSEYLPMAQEASRAIKAMPKGTEADALARVAEMMRRSKAFAARRQ